MNIKDWPADQRPREKLLKQGAASLTDAELLAIFLRTGVAGCNAVELAQQALTQFGSLRALLGAELDCFSQGRGLGSAKYAQLQACVEMTKRYMTESLAERDVMTSVKAVSEFLTAHLRDEPYEVFAVMYLDVKHHLIDFAKEFYGTIDASAVYPRVIVKKALDKGASAIVIAHNHPSGVAEPSMADRHITKRLNDALALVDVRLLDHFVIGDNEFTSFAERGLL